MNGWRLPPNRREETPVVARHDNYSRRELKCSTRRTYELYSVLICTYLEPVGRGFLERDTRGRTRTGTAFQPRDFKSHASTISPPGCGSPFGRLAIALLVRATTPVTGRECTHRGARTRARIVVQSAARSPKQETVRLHGRTAGASAPTVFSKRETGLEPATPTLARLCSTN